MDYIQITKENIDKEHICCAMSGKQSLAKKEWLKQRFAEGLVFYRSVERGKCFIEYIPAENAWVPITADGWLYINCLWVSGSMKGHGCSNDLLEKCLSDARAQGKKGICILCAEGRKREFLADPKFLSHKGFEVADVSDCGITLMCLPLNADTALPKFKNCAKHPKADGEGFVLYYTDQCPFTYYWVPKVQQAAQQHNIPFRAIHITDTECIRTRHDLRTVPGRRIPDAGYPVRQKVSGIGRCTDMKERIVDEQIRLIPYYQNDAVSFCRYQDADVCKQVDNWDTPHDLALLHRM